MTINSNMRWALDAMIDLARAESAGPVNVPTIAQRHTLPGTTVAKVFQRLVWAGLVVGTRGAHGGYRLARPAHEITVLDVVRVFEPEFPGEPDESSLEVFLRMLDEQTRETFATVTIARLAAIDSSRAASQL